MEQAFRSYAKYYDIIYGDKDYEKECDFLERIFAMYSKLRPRRILDVGCGTGGHAIPLAKRGYEVTGVDLSEQMISIAKEKANNAGVGVEFHVMDVRELVLEGRYDACICMFAVLDYLATTTDLLEALSRIRKCLKNDSLFVFDVWYGPAVLTILPTERMKEIETQGLKVIRFAEPQLDASRQLCEVTYYLLVTRGSAVVFEGREKHALKFYFPEEMKHYLEESGFHLLKLCSLIDLATVPNEKTWNVTVIARRV